VAPLFALLALEFGWSLSQLLALTPRQARAFARQIPALRANAQLARVEATSYPHLSAQDRQSVFNRLQSQLAGEASPHPPAKRVITDFGEMAAFVGRIGRA
jgi:hypothetical protein